MRAVTLAAFGDLDVLNFGEVPTPSPKSGHVLIRSGPSVRARRPRRFAPAGGETGG